MKKQAILKILFTTIITLSLINLAGATHTVIVGSTLHWIDKSSGHGTFDYIVQHSLPPGSGVGDIYALDIYFSNNIFTPGNVSWTINPWGTEGTFIMSSTQFSRWTMTSPPGIGGIAPLTSLSFQIEFTGADMTEWYNPTNWYNNHVGAQHVVTTDNGSYPFSMSTGTVPEPTSLLLVGVGLLGLGVVRRRRKK